MTDIFNLEFPREQSFVSWDNGVFSPLIILLMLWYFFFVLIQIICYQPENQFEWLNVWDFPTLTWLIANDSCEEVDETWKRWSLENFAKRHDRVRWKWKRLGFDLPRRRWKVTVTAWVGVWQRHRLPATLSIRTPRTSCVFRLALLFLGTNGRLLKTSQVEAEMVFDWAGLG